MLYGVLEGEVLETTVPRACLALGTVALLAKNQRQVDCGCITGLTGATDTHAHCAGGGAAFAIADQIGELVVTNKITMWYISHALAIALPKTYQIGTIEICLVAQNN